MSYVEFDFAKKCTDFKMILVERKIKSAPQIIISELETGARDGSIPTRVKLGKGSIKLVFECFDSRDNIYDDIRNFINYLNPKNGEKKIRFSDELHVYRNALLSSGSDIENFYAQFLTFGKFELEFTMFDPYTYSTTPKKFYYNGINRAIGKFNNLGGAECPIIIKIYPPKGIVKERIEEDNTTYISYYGEWANYSSSYFSGGKSKYASGTGSSATLIFSGSEVRIYGLKSAGKGFANIYLDDDLIAEVDCYAPSEVWNSLLFEKVNIPKGVHKLKIEVSGKKNNDAVGYQVNFDYFEITTSSIPEDTLPMEIEGDTYNYSTVPSIENVVLTFYKQGGGAESIGFNSIINPTSELIIDTDEFEMHLDGESAIQHWVGVFPTIYPGENKLIVSDKDSKGALVIVEFRERWV